MSLAQADGAEVGGAGAGGQGGPTGGVPRPALAAVAHTRVARSVAQDQSFYGKQMCGFIVARVECGG